MKTKIPLPGEVWNRTGPSLTSTWKKIRIFKIRTFSTVRVEIISLEDPTFYTNVRIKYIEDQYRYEN